MNWLFWAIGTALGTGVGVLYAAIVGPEHTFPIAFLAAAVSTAVKKTAQAAEAARHPESQKVEAP